MEIKFVLNQHKVKQHFSILLTLLTVVSYPVYVFFHIISEMVVWILMVSAGFFTITLTNPTGPLRYTTIVMFILGVIGLITCIP